MSGIMHDESTVRAVLMEVRAGTPTRHIAKMFKMRLGTVRSWAYAYRVIGTPKWSAQKFGKIEPIIIDIKTMPGVDRSKLSKQKRAKDLSLEERIETFKRVLTGTTQGQDWYYKILLKTGRIANSTATTRRAFREAKQQVEAEAAKKPAVLPVETPAPASGATLVSTLTAAVDERAEAERGLMHAVEKLNVSITKLTVQLDLLFKPAPMPVDSPTPPPQRSLSLWERVAKLAHD